MYSLRNEITVLWFVFLQFFASGYRLFLSTAVNKSGLVDRSRIFGHQNIAASLHILFIPGCPMCSALRAAYRSDFGSTMRSSTIMMPQRWLVLWLRFCSCVGFVPCFVVFDTAVQLDKVEVSGRFFKYCFQV